MLIYSSKWWVVLLQWWISLDNHIQLLELPIHTHPPQLSFSRKKVCQEDCDNAGTVKTWLNTTSTDLHKGEGGEYQAHLGSKTQHIQDTCHHDGCKSNRNAYVLVGWKHAFLASLRIHLSFTSWLFWAKEQLRDRCPSSENVIPSISNLANPQRHRFCKQKRSESRCQIDPWRRPTIDHKEDASFSSCHKYSSSTSNNWSCRQVNRIALIFFTSPSGEVPSNCGSFHAYTDISF